MAVSGIYKSILTFIMACPTIYLQQKQNMLNVTDLTPNYSKGLKYLH